MSGPICWLILLAGTAVLCRPETIPLTRGTTLAGGEMELPRDLGPGYSILIIGFSEKSAESARAWGKGLPAAFGSETVQPVCYQIPVLAGLPRLFRGLVLRSMKKDVPNLQQRTFLPVFDQEREWKRVARFREADDAYVILVRQTGEVLWTSYGPISQASILEIKKRMAEPAGR